MDKALKAAKDLMVRDAFLASDQMQRLTEHKYSSDDQSFLTGVGLNKFWNKVTTFYPVWLAPNLITLTGLIVNVGSIIILASYSPDCLKPAPSWAYFLCAFSLFFYQTLDSTDGKQARRTRTSSPMGELFDHGCDAFTQVFLAMDIAMAMLLGDQKWHVMHLWIIANMLFYMAHWSTYVTGTLRFGRFDIIESQCVLIGFLLISGTFGPEVWMTRVFGITLRRMVLFPCFLMSIYVCAVNLYVISTRGAGKNGTSVANTSVIAPILPLLMFTVPSMVVYWKSTTPVFDQHIFLYCTVMGLIYTKVSHMSRSPMPITDTTLLIPLVMFINQLLGTPISEYFLLYVCLVYGAVNVLCYSVVTCQQICTYMKIECFRIPYHPSDAMNGSMANGFHDTH